MQKFEERKGKVETIYLYYNIKNKENMLCIDVVKTKWQHWKCQYMNFQYKENNIFAL